MGLSEYWDGAPELTKYYREAHKQRQERENQKAWLQGRYIYEALCCVSPILHAFAKKGTKPIPYLEQPFELTSRPSGPETENEKAERRHEERKDALREKILKGMKRINQSKFGGG